MTHLRGTASDHVEHFKSRCHFAGTEDFYRDASAAGFGNHLGQSRSSGAKPGEVGGPGGHHFPLQLQVGLRGIAARALFRTTGRQTGRYRSNTGTFH